MNAEYINAFIQGAQNTINMITGETPELGKVFIKNKTYNFQDVTVYIGITGDVEGYALYSASDSDGLKIVSKMMMGMIVTTWDDMSQSAMKELCNMISGSVVTEFSKSGKIVDITPPNLVNNFVPLESEFINVNSVIIGVPLIFKDGSKFELNLLLTKE